MFILPYTTTRLLAIILSFQRGLSDHWGHAARVSLCGKVFQNEWKKTAVKNQTKDQWTLEPEIC